MTDSVLPSGWKWAPLEQLVEPVLTKDPSLEPEIEITYFDIGSINNETGLVTGQKRIPSIQAPSRARQIVREGDILFSTVRPYLRAIAQVPVADNSMASTGFCVLRPAVSVSAKYLFHFVRSEDFLNKLLPLQRGVSYPAVRDGDVLAQKVPLAPSAEQTRIVEKLEELFSDLDAGVAELKAAQTKLAQYRQALLKAAVEGALTAEWRAARSGEQETGAQLLDRILAERRRRWEEKQLAKFQQQGKTPPKGWQDKYPEPVQPDTTDLPALPEGWVWGSIDQLAVIGTGVTPLRSNARYFDGGEIPWVTSGALNDEVVETATELVSRLALQECRLEVYPVGTLLVAMYGEGKTRGKCSELAIPATINQAIAALVPEGLALDCKAYLKSFLTKSYEDMRNQASGGVQPNLNLQIIRSIAVPLPPLAEQIALQKVLSAQLDLVRDQLSAVDHALSQSAAQRQNLLKAAFSGQLVPQDPDDEPASVLLERIRAERRDQSSSRANKRSTARSRKESTC